MTHSKIIIIIIIIIMSHSTRCHPYCQPHSVTSLQEIWIVSSSSLRVTPSPGSREASAAK